MAKKKSATARIGMAEEIRSLLTANPKLSGKETLEAIKAKFPETPINEKSFGVGFYMARKKLGISSTRRGASAKKVVVRKMPSAARPSVDMTALQAAAKFLTQVGSAETAIEAIKQVQALQLG